MTYLIYCELLDEDYRLLVDPLRKDQTEDFPKHFWSQHYPGCGLAFSFRHLLIYLALVL